MISKAWRERLIYIAMSAFVAWHSIAIIIAPAPRDSVTVREVRAVVQPYLTLFRLDNVWNFFSPIVGATSQFRYVIETGAGEKLTVIPEEKYSSFDPNYFLLKAWHNAVIDSPDEFADIAAARYCRMHASLQPVSITLLEMQEQQFTQADLLAGKHRWDPEFYTLNTIKQVECPAQ